MTPEEFLFRASELRVDGVSIESCFLPDYSSSYLGGLKKLLDEYKLDRVYAWGHPDGLAGGRNQEAYGDMIRSLERAKLIGADVMRVVGSSLRFRHEPHQPQIERLTAMFRDAVKVAESQGIRLAVENHIDFTADEMLGLVEGVGSPYLGINFDTGNLLRLLAGAGYQGFLAVEIDFLHPDYNNDEDAAVEQSVRELRRIAAIVGAERAVK
jgi:sugar phosphate isomerase/epimerase